MNRTLRKAAFVQMVPYSSNEGRLAQYHGAIFAERLRSWGVDATKMVVGNPATDKPVSPLLSVSSPQQRVSPEYWREKDYDLVVLYGGEDLRNIPMMKAIKQGSPSTALILKMDAAYGPFLPTARGAFQKACVVYVKTRHGHWARGKDGQIPGSRRVATLMALAQGMRLFSPRYRQRLESLYAAPDFVSFENQYAIRQAKTFFLHVNRPDLADKIIWLGYPARDSLAEETAGSQRRPDSVISIANWKHAKDLPLHAKTTALLLERDPAIHFAIIGANSQSLRDLVLRLSPRSSDRVLQIEEIPNKEIVRYLCESQVFMLCSSSEGICSAVLEAFCCGCSAALSTGIAVPCFKEFVEDDCGTQAVSRSPEAMAEAVLKELDAWRRQQRDATVIRHKWERTLVSNLCQHLFTTTGLELSKKA